MRPRLAGLHLTCTQGQFLPHMQAPYVPLFLTFRLRDSLPNHVLAELPKPGPRAGPAERIRYRQRVEDALDHGRGSCVLKDPVVAAIVERSLREGDGVRYRLLAWCVMPNHVHVVVSLLPGARLEAVVRTWKGASSRRINQHLGQTGVLWQPDYFDRVVGSDRSLESTIAYVERNPVVAGLVARPEDWRFSSAARRKLEDANDVRV